MKNSKNGEYSVAVNHGFNGPIFSLNPNADAAQLAQYGGINFDPKLLDLRIKRDENFVSF